MLTQPAIRRIKLEDFGRDAIDALLRDRYGGDGAGVADWLLDRTDGNPLFLEQFLATLEEQGVLQRRRRLVARGAIAGGRGDWRLSGALAHARTPDTLLELLRPRIADLDDEEKALLEPARSRDAASSRRWSSSCWTATRTRSSTASGGSRRSAA